MASGVNGFPKDEALEIALSEIGSFLLTHEMKVLLVVFDSRALQLSEHLAAVHIVAVDDDARVDEFELVFRALRIQRAIRRVVAVDVAAFLLCYLAGMLTGGAGR